MGRPFSFCIQSYLQKSLEGFISKNCTADNSAMMITGENAIFLNFACLLHIIYAKAYYDPIPFSVFFQETQRLLDYFLKRQLTTPKPPSKDTEGDEFD